jgi:ABC-2 type transport system ATP-binding protein
VHERIEELHCRGVTIVLTTHDMHEAEKLCERVAIIDHGKVLALDTPDALRRLVPAASALELTVDRRGGLDGIDGALASLPHVERVERVASSDPEQNGGAPPVLRIYSRRGTELIPAALHAVTARGGEVSDLRVTKATLEDVFIQLTGRAMR